MPHPEEVATPETLALWAKVRKELEARNYTRPTNKQVRRHRPQGAQQQAHRREEAGDHIDTYRAHMFECMRLRCL
jgi:hypothetical protein